MANPNVHRYRGDSPVELTRRVALSYRRLAEQLTELLAEHLPVDHRALEAVADLDRYWQNDNQGNQLWVVPQLAPPGEDDLLTTSEVAAQAYVSPAAVRMWNSRAKQGLDGVRAIDTPDGPRFRWGDVLEYKKRRRARRAQ